MAAIASRAGASALAAAAFALVLSPAAARFPVPALDVDELVAQADFIVVGRETAIQDLRPAPPRNQLPGRLIRTTVNASVVIKGPRESWFDYTSVVWGTDQPMPPRAADPNERVFFMRKTASGLQSATDFYSSVVGSSRAVIPAAAQPLQAVVASIAAAMTDPGAAEARRLEATRTLTATTSPEAIAPLRSVLADRSIPVRTQAAIELVGKNDTAGLSIVDDLLTHPGARATGFVQDATYAVSSGLKRDDAIPALERWLESADLEIRRASAHALYQTGSEAAQRGLARCLSDSDVEVRYSGVAGLAKSTGQNEWYPAIPTFKLSEARYLDHWKAWARAKGLIRD